MKSGYHLCGGGIITPDFGAAMLHLTDGQEQLEMVF
jgi:hypothetical protein